MKGLTHTPPLISLDKDRYGRVVVQVDDLIEALYQNPSLDISQVSVCDTEEVQKYNQSVEQTFSDLPKLKLSQKLQSTVQEFDQENQSNWYTPEEYRNIDIAQMVLYKCQTDEELQRVGHELLVFQRAGLMPVLSHLHYMIETFRKNNIVWGVGRGSAVASYVLYLLEVHDIDSLYYGLEFEEFLDLGDEYGENA